MKTNKGSTGNKHRPEVDARILGQILAAQNIEFALPNTNHIAEFFAETLMTIPGVLSCRVCLEDMSIQKGEMGSGICEECVSSRRKSAEQKDLHLFSPDFKCRLADHSGVQFNAINSLHHHFGFFVFQIDDPEVFDVYKPFIVNLANYVAISLENRQQRELLQRAHDELEHKVEKRTQELRASNEAIKDLYNNAPCGYHSLDKDGIFILINDTELRWLGYSRDEIIGRLAIRDLFTPNSLKTFEANFQGFKERGWVSDLEFEMVRKDGTLLPVLLNATAITDEDGNYVMSRSTTFDITARKQAEEKLQERERHSQSLLRLSRNLERSQTYAEVLNAARDEVRNIIGYQNLWAFLFTEDKKYAKALVAGGPMSDEVMSEDGVATLTIEGDKMLEEIAEAKEIVVIEDARTDERTDKEIVARLGNQTIINVPIILFDRHLGSIGTGTFGDEGVRVPAKAEQEYLMALASHMAVSLDRIHLLNKRRQAEQSLRESEERFRSFVEKANDIVYTVSPDGIFTYVSPNWKEILGHEISEVEGKSYEIFVHPDDLAACREILSRTIISGEKQSGFEYRVKHKNGSWQWHTSNSSVIRDRDERIIAFLGIARNVTERKHADDALRRLNRELLAISNCNQVLMRAVDEHTLLNDICRIVCDEAGYRLAWVGYAENDEAQTVRPVSWAGTEDGYLASANITWADTERGRGPTGTAIRSGESACIRDFMTDPKAAPWREKALQRGYRSSIALPLKDESAKVFGTLTIYSTEPDAFTSDEIRLLEELAGDLAFGIVVLRARAERKRVEENLRVSEEKYRALAENIPSVVFQCRNDSRYTFVYLNSAIEKLTGYSKDDFLEKGFSFFDLYHPDDLKTMPTPTENNITDINRNPFHITYRIRHKSGEWRWVDEWGTGIMGSDGKVEYLEGIMVDITERKRNERELIILNHAINQSSDAVFLINEQLTFAYVNDAACLSLGYTREELLTMRPSDIDAVITYDAAKDIMDEQFANGHYARFETQHKTRDGHVFPVEISSSVVEYDGAKFSLTTVHDITERKQAEQALRESEERLRQIASSLREVIWLRDVKTRRVLYVNPAFQELTGRTCESFYENRDVVIDAVHPDDREMVTKALNQRSESAYYDKEHRIIHLDGSAHWVSSQSFPVRNEAGEVYRWATIMEDITERKQAEEALRESEEKFRSFIEESSEGITLVDEQGAIIEWNHAREKITGFPASQVIGKKLWDVQYQMIAPELQTPEFYERFKQTLLNALQTGQSPIFDRVTEAEVLHPKSPSQFIQQTIFPIKTDKGYRIGSVTHDVTERKQAEQNLRQMNERFSLAARAARLGVWDWDIQKDELVWDDGMYELYGVKREDFAGAYEAWLKGIHPDDRTPSDEISQQARRGEREYDTEFRVVWPDGSVHYLKAHGQFVRDADGKPLRMTGVNFDITASKQAEAEIQALARFPSENPNPVMRVTRGGILLYANLSSVDLIRDWNCSVGEQLPEFWRKLVLEALNFGLPQEAEVACGERLFTLTFAPIMESGYVNLYGRDITEYRRADAALKRSESFSRSIIENEPECVKIVGAEGILKYMNPAGLAMIEVEDLAVVAGHSVYPIVVPEHREAFIDLTKKVLRGERDNLQFEIIGLKGTRRWLDTHAVPLFDDQGNVEALLGLTRDVTERKRAEEALRESERRYRDIFDNVLDGLYLLDVTEDGRFRTVEVNPALERVTGIPRSQSIGKTQEETVPENVARLVNEKYRHCVEAGHPIEEELELDLPSGRHIFHSSLIPARDETGRVSRIIGISRDITDRKRAEEEIARSLEAEKKAREVAEILREANESLSRTLNLEDVLQNLLQYLNRLVPYDSANVMLLEEDFQLRVVAESGYERWTDIDVARKITFDVRTAPVLNELVTMQKSLLIMDSREHPGWVRPAGAEHVISWVGIPIIADRQVIGLYSVDKTEPGFFTEEHCRLAEGLAGQAAVAIQNTRLHAQIKRANIELEQRILDRTAQLETANKELEAFAYSVSHDLRAPLRHIDGFIEMLQSRAKTTLDDKSQHYMEVIADSARKMGTLIDDLLSFSRMGRTEMSKSQVDLGELVKGVIQELSPETKGRDIQWKISPLPLVTGDRSMLHIVMINLLSNALKFTRTRQQAEIEIGYQPDIKDETVVFIRDNGVGFDMEYADKLFGVFQRLHRLEDFEGTGIGLANVHRIIHRHGGKIWAEGKTDHGATFYFSLPQLKN